MELHFVIVDSFHFRVFARDLDNGCARFTLLLFYNKRDKSLVLFEQWSDGTLYDVTHMFLAR